MDLDLMNVVVPVASALGSALLGAVFWGLRLLAKKTKIAYVEGVVSRAQDAVLKAYLEVKQSYVDNVKDMNGNGKIDAHEAAAAKEFAIRKAKSYLGPKGLKELGVILGAEDLVDSFIGTEIEANVAADKLAKKS